LSTAFEGQTVREVGVRELSHSTAAVIRAVREGERLVVTRHAEPQAVVLSVNDAVELSIEGERVASACAAERDYAEGAVEELGPSGPVPVVLARAAVVSCQRMNARDRRLLRDLLVRGEADEERLLWLTSRRWLIAFSYPDEATALVHQAFEVRELIRAAVGDDVSDRRRRIEQDRWLHGRSPWQLATELDGNG
jgi:prevent-host-death family protein